jgi:hypothetical protein
MERAVARAASVATPVARPVLQTKPRIGAVNDPLEREADWIADAVVADTAIGPIGVAAPGIAQRKCAQCEADEEKTLRRKCGGCAQEPVSQSSAGAAAEAVSRGGVALSPEQRAYFEPRFGRDLLGVRIHAHDRAAAAAQGIGARAFALGRDIAFAPGEYRPASGAGRHLLAHELAHTLQQGADETAVVRRATYGTLPAPVWGSVTLGQVPDDERAHVDEAITKIDAVVADPTTYRECHQNYAKQCPGGTDRTLRDLWNRIVLWRITSADPGVYARARTNEDNIGYNPMAYDQGTLGLAATIMHEAGHCCGIPGGDTHWHADLVANYCMGPDSANAFSMSFGGGIGGNDPLWLFAYRRFLGDWAGGRLRATLGVDLNILGISSEIAERNYPATSRSIGDFGGAMLGFQARLGGWGGSRYGGFSFRFETGLGAGRFALRPAAPDEAPATAVAPSWVLQVGPRAEFLIPIGGGRALPISLGAALRLAVPLNIEASALQGALLSIEIR